MRPGSRWRILPELVRSLFDEELRRLVEEFGNGKDPGSVETLRAAREISEEMILRGEINPS